MAAEYDNSQQDSSIPENNLQLPGEEELTHLTKDEKEELSLYVEVLKFAVEEVSGLGCGISVSLTVAKDTAGNISPEGEKIFNSLLAKRLQNKKNLDNLK